MGHRRGSFDWDPRKEWLNIAKHGVDFVTASQVFKDPNFIVTRDSKHSARETRYFAIGKVRRRVLTVRFTYRVRRIRIIGAGYWRKGERFYEKENG